MKPKKLSPEMINFFFGSYPISLSDQQQASLLDNRIITFKVDFNSSDIQQIIQVIYEGDEIEIEIPKFRKELVATRLANFEREQKLSSDLWRCKFDLLRFRRLDDLDPIENRSH